MPSLGMRQIHVRAAPDASAPQGVRFELFEGGAQVQDGKLSSSKNPGNSKHHDFHEFRFILQDGGTNLVFDEPASAAMTVTDGNADIEPLSVSQNGKMLEVRNFNRSAVESKFDLNFVRKGTQDRVVYDPIWANNNGGTA